MFLFIIRRFIGVSYGARHYKKARGCRQLQSSGDGHKIMGDEKNTVNLFSYL